MRRRRVTFADIAAAAGVSPATVSMVLHGSPLVAADTRARVEEQLRKQGYVYNRAAADLRRRRSSSVAMVINDLSNPFFAEFAAGVDEALAGAGFITLLGSTGESTERQQKVLTTLMEHDPAGIILSPAEGSDGLRLLEAIGTHTPTLVFNRDLPQSQDVVPQWDFLALDNRHGARLATEHLLHLGHQRIAFFGGHVASSSCSERRKGFLDAMTAAGIGIEPRWLIESAPTRLEAAMQTGALFVCDPTPTAAVCYNDAVALGLMLGLAARGRRPGLDFAVTGFDDIPETVVSTPPLTTISTDPRKCGRRAAGYLLARIGDPGIGAARRISPVELVVRGSTCPAPGFKVRPGRKGSAR
ncbi:MAG TPA: LacI family DNA-binding transcriptional regulator [Xanthomonadaceae bacterium]|nr:LacI family DNA-binding transcriptional regulator [Xanthomonadaceae bacterium]